MSHQPIEELDVFRIFEDVTRWVWKTVKGSEYLDRKAFGIQLVSAMDSVNANLVEGDGRFSIGDSVHFFVIARASAREAKLWITRAIERGLCAEEEGNAQIREIVRAAKLLNLLINYRRKNQKGRSIREFQAAYGVPVDLCEDEEPWP